jgi:hypothetical protein
MYSKCAACPNVHLHKLTRIQLYHALRTNAIGSFGWAYCAIANYTRRQSGRLKVVVNQHRLRMHPRPQKAAKHYACKRHKNCFHTKLLMLYRKQNHKLPVTLFDASLLHKM